MPVVRIIGMPGTFGVEEQDGAEWLLLGPFRSMEQVFSFLRRAYPRGYRLI